MRWLPIAAAAVGAAAIGVGVAVALDLRSGPDPEVGALDEVRRAWRPGDGPPARLTDVTESWGATAAHEGSDPLSGGIAAVDLDLDGRLDLAVAGGPLTLLFGRDDGLQRVVVTRPRFDGRVTAVSASDLDADGWPDLLVARRAGPDSVVWGGPWARARDPERAMVDRLPSGDRTTALVAGDLTRDGRADILQAAYGYERPARDAVLEQVASRRFRSVPLPGGPRRSLAAEVGDLDGDGWPEAWVTRDVGWEQGGDSVFRSTGASETGFADVARELGADIEIDGMSVTLADLGGDEGLDAYVPDIGENELLLAGGGRLRPAHDVGAGRIRRPGGPASEVSSSWSSGAADLNLDGRLDLVVANGGFAAGDVVNKVPGARIAVDDPPAILLGRPDGTFADVWPALGLDWSGAARGMALGDLDDDGDQDLAVLVVNEGLRVYRNDAEGASVTVRAAASACPTSGTVVRVAGADRRLARLLGAHGFAGSHAPEVTVGTRGLPTRITVGWSGLPEVTRRASGKGRLEISVPCPGGPAKRGQP